MADPDTRAISIGRDRARTAIASLVASLGFGLLAYGSVTLLRVYNQAAPIWLSNAFVVGCLLLVDTRRWAWMLLAALAGGLIAGLNAGDSITINFVLALFNIWQAWACAWAVRRVLGRDIDLGRPRDMVVFVGLAGFLAPLITGAAAALYHTAMRGGDWWGNLCLWVLGDMLGVLTLTSCMLVLSRARTYLRERPLSRDGVLSIVALLVGAWWVFGQARYPVLFLVPPLMLLVASRQEVIGGVVGATLVGAIAVLMTLSGHGPIRMIDGAAQQSLVLQLFLAVSIFVSLPVAAFQRQRRHILDEMARASEAVTRSEARYRLLTENALDLIVHTGLDGRVSYISPASLALLGYTPEEMIGTRAIDMVHPDDFDRVVAISQHQVSGGVTGAPDRIEYQAYRKDGQLIWLESRPTLARDPVSGEKIGITDIVRDITARKKMERDLREAQARAEAAAAAKGEFLANMSHELRTPLTAVIGFANLVEDQPELSIATRRQVGRILDGGRSLLATIDDILDFSRLDAGHLEFKPRRVVVADLVREVLEVFTPSAADKGLTLTVEWLDGLPRDLWLDPERVRHVLVNLVGNAIKFTDTGGVILRLTHDVARDRLNFEIRDTGQGIAAEDLPLLFMRFSQVDVSISRQHGGTGLGLAICKGLVELMGGQISVESEIGVGTRFAFDLPAPIDPGGEVEDQPELASLPAGCRVLVVDDNAANRELVRTVLEAFEAEVSEAVDGEAGVIAAEADIFDIILMDLRMPRMDGAEAAARIRAGQGPSAGAPIIAFSADVRAGAPAAVFDGAVPKPMTVASLVNAIAAALAA